MPRVFRSRSRFRASVAASCESSHSTGRHRIAVITAKSCLTYGQLVAYPSRVGNGNLLNRTHELLKNRGRLTLVQISEESRLDYSWLNKFSQGRIPNPGVRFVQTLHDYLAPRVKVRRLAS
jgi:hypothetical protein